MGKRKPVRVKRMTGIEGLSTDIGKSLQWLRKSLLITQYQLATLAHLDYRHYQNIETGRVEVKVETLKRVCTALGMSLSSFFAILDSQVWLRETPSRSKGGGELFVFRLRHENSIFPLHDDLRHALMEWGRDLSEGNAEHLKRLPYPCFAVDKDGRAVWGNGVDSPYADARISDGETKDLSSLAPDFAGDLRRFLASTHTSFYRNLSDREDSSAVLVALKPMVPKEDARLFVACVHFPKAAPAIYEETSPVYSMAAYKHSN